MHHQKKRIDRFELIRRLGRGAQGSVFLAWDPRLEREVALKLLHMQTPDGLAPRPTLLEARIGGKLRHPNVVSIYDAGEYRGLPYLVFEYVKGETLRELLNRQGSMSIADACRTIGPVLDAIAHAHGLGIVHLDLSPGNVLVDETGNPRVMDFGLARFCDMPQRTGELPAGTVRYMAPEIFDGKPLGPAADVYALCLIFYELVAGQPARQGKSLRKVLEQVTNGKIDMRPLGKGRDSERLARLLSGGLERDPKARYPDGKAMLESFRLQFPGPATGGTQGRQPTNGTVSFLLQRMRRRQEFPVLSRSLMEINRLTAHDSNASASQLAKVVLTDYSLSQKLLKMANSVLYSGGVHKVTTVSGAVRLLGVRQVRSVANSLALFSHLRDGPHSSALLDNLLRSFMAGLLARHLVKRNRVTGVEDAFICGMFQNLGENLALYYFPDEYVEVRELMAGEQLGRSTASREVLGITYAELGVAVARHWQFPDAIQRVIEGLPDGHLEPPGSPEERLRAYCVFAAELCDIPGRSVCEVEYPALLGLAARFAPCFPLNEQTLYKLLGAGLGKLEELAPVLGVDLADCSLRDGINDLRAFRECKDLAATDPDGTPLNPLLTAGAPLLAGAPD